MLSKMLSEGELHGAVVPGDNGYAGLFGGGETPPMMAAYPGVKPLFEDNQEIIDYMKQTGINPIMHVLVDPPRSRRALSRLSRRN